MSGNGQRIFEFDGFRLETENVTSKIGYDISFTVHERSSSSLGEKCFVFRNHSLREFSAEGSDRGYPLRNRTWRSFI